MANINLVPVKREDFVPLRTTKGPTVIDPAVLEQIVTLLRSNDGSVGGSEFYTATKNETDVYNGKRETAAKSAGKEVPAPINLVQMATRNARSAANELTPYFDQIVDTIITDKSYSLRFVNRGTEDHPKVQWAFVLVSKRAPRAK